MIVFYDLDLHIRRIQSLKNELNITFEGLCHKLEKERLSSCEQTREIVQTPKPAKSAFDRDNVIGKLNYTTKQYTENDYNVVRIQYEWQTVFIHSDRIFTSEEIKLCAQTLHNTVFLITRIFKFTRDAFVRTKLPTDINVFAFENRMMYDLAVSLRTEKQSLKQTCGVAVGEEIYVSLSNCLPFYDTFAHEYAHYLNTYLLQIPPKSDWWNEGLATYVTDRCTNNIRNILDVLV